MKAIKESKYNPNKSLLEQCLEHRGKMEEKENLVESQKREEILSQVDFSIMNRMFRR